MITINKIIIIINNCMLTSGMTPMTKQDNNCDSCAQKGSCKDQSDCTCKVDRMAKIKHKIIIASGKGGVGKSTVSVNLARALQMKGLQVGILDADITGPDIPKLLGIEEAKLKQGTDGIEPALADGIVVASMALILSSRETPVVWRGPMKMAAIKQFIQDVNWGDLDFLLIDLPPGTSDEPLSVVQLIPELAGAIIVPALLAGDDPFLFLGQGTRHGRGGEGGRDSRGGPDASLVFPRLPLQIFKEWLASRGREGGGNPCVTVLEHPSVQR